MSQRGVGILWVFAALFVDQGSKAVVHGTSALAAGIDVLPVLNFVLVRNDGISFGLLGGIAPWWALVALGSLLVIGLSNWLWRAQSKTLATGLGLLIGGALGNILDRVRHGAVTDFLDFHVAGYHWPAFNFADVAVVCGVAILLLDSFRLNRTTDQEIAHDGRERQR